MLQQQPDFVHQFYTDDSTMVRIDGESTETASAIFQIHTLIQSLNFSGIEIKTINSLESLNGGVLVVVSGSMRSKYFSGWRKFVQTFFLAPQEKGYFVLNDIFHFVSEDLVHHHPAPPVPENNVDYLPHQPAPIEPEHHVDYQPTFSSPPPESAVPEDALEVETRENLNSIHLEGDDQDDDYSSEEQYQHDDPVAESVEEKPVEEPSVVHQNTVDFLHQNAVDFVKEPPPPAVEEPVGEPVKLTYASILRAKGKSMPSVAPQSSFNKGAPPASEWHQIPEPIAQRPVSPLPYSSDYTPEVVEEGSSREEEGESKSVYVRNLPTTVSTLDIVQEFKNFGSIKNDGVFLKNRKDVGVCFAFVEFEDVEGVQKAIEASPIQIAGRQVYIEERRANSSSTSRGGRRGGRGRGSYQSDGTRGRYGTGSFGRGGNQDGGDNYRPRGNGFRS